MKLVEYLDILEKEFSTSNKCYDSDLHSYSYTPTTFRVPHNPKINITEVDASYDAFNLKTPSSFEYKLVEKKDVKTLVARHKISYQEYMAPSISEKCKAEIRFFIKSFQEQVNINPNKLYIGILSTLKRPGRDLEYIRHMEDEAAVEIRLYSQGLNIED